jgi:hypothetical protein
MTTLASSSQSTSCITASRGARPERAPPSFVENYPSGEHARIDECQVLARVGGAKPIEAARRLIVPAAAVSATRRLLAPVARPPRVEALESLSGPSRTRPARADRDRSGS